MEYLVLPYRRGTEVEKLTAASVVDALASTPEKIRFAIHSDGRRAVIRFSGHLGGLITLYPKGALVPLGKARKGTTIERKAYATLVRSYKAAAGKKTVWITGPTVGVYRRLSGGAVSPLMEAVAAALNDTGGGIVVIELEHSPKFLKGIDRRLLFTPKDSKVGRKKLSRLEKEESATFFRIRVVGVCDPSALFPILGISAERKLKLKTGSTNAVERVLRREIGIDRADDALLKRRGGFHASGETAALFVPIPGKNSRAFFCLDFPAGGEPPDGPVYLGEAMTTRGGERVGIEVDDFKVGALVLGIPGSGKTEFTKGRAIEAFLNGADVIFIDPKAQATDDLLQQVFAADPDLDPSSVLWFDPLRYSLRFNALVPTKEENRSEQIMYLISVLAKAFDVDSYGSERAALFRKFIAASVRYAFHLTETPTLVELRDAMQAVVNFADNRPVSTPDALVNSAVSDFRKAFSDGKEAERYVAPIIDAVSNLLANETVGKSFCRADGITYDQIFSKHRMVLWRLDPGMSEESLNILVRLIFAGIYRYARLALGKGGLKRPILLIIDEMHRVVNVFQEEIKNMAAEGRSLKTWPILITQDMEQIKDRELRETIWGTIGMKVIFKQNKRLPQHYSSSPDFLDAVAGKIPMYWYLLILPPHVTGKEVNLVVQAPPPYPKAEVDLEVYGEEVLSEFTISEDEAERYARKIASSALEQAVSLGPEKAARYMVLAAAEFGRALAEAATGSEPTFRYDSAEMRAAADTLVELLGDAFPAMRDVRFVRGKRRLRSLGGGRKRDVVVDVPAGGQVGDLVTALLVLLAAMRSPESQYIFIRGKKDRRIITDPEGEEALRWASGELKNLLTLALGTP